jgi:hypothetical protein
MNSILLAESRKRDLGRRKRLSLHSSRACGQFLIDPVAVPRNERLDCRHRHSTGYDDLDPPVEMNAQRQSTRPYASAQGELKTGRTSSLVIEG